MKKSARIVRNHPAFDRTANRWVRIVGLHKGGVLDVAALGNPDSRSYNLHTSQVALWHPDKELNEAYPVELLQIPVGSKVVVGPTRYTRVYGGWLAKHYEDLLEFETSWFLPDPTGIAKSTNRWKVDCSTHSGEPDFLEVPR